jgi:hypothetical protein
MTKLPTNHCGELKRVRQLAVRQYRDALLALEVGDVGLDSERDGFLRVGVGEKECASGGLIDVAVDVEVVLG